MKRLSLVSSKSWFDSQPMIEKSSQAITWLLLNMWSLTDLDNVTLAHLPVLGDTIWRSET